MRINLTVLAKMAGVAPSTVSRAFSGSPDISEETREHIYSIAKREGVFDFYFKNRYFKKVIGVICPEITSGYYAAMLSVLDREIRSRNGIMTVSVTNFDRETCAELYTYYTSYCNVDGVIVIGGEIDGLKNPRLVPTVAFGSNSLPGIDAISIDHITSIREVIRLLKELGHTSIGFAGERLTQEKLSHFEVAMQENALPLRREQIRVSSKRFEEAGEELADEWLRSGDLPTAILAGYDDIAIGLIKVLRKNGIRVPEDLSVIGMDDISINSYLDIPLSTIRTDWPAACRAAMDLLEKKFENQYYSPRTHLSIPSAFILRATVGTAKK